MRPLLSFRLSDSILSREAALFSNIQTVLKKEFKNVKKTKKESKKFP